MAHHNICKHFRSTDKNHCFILVSAVPEYSAISKKWDIDVSSYLDWDVSWYFFCEMYLDVKLSIQKYFKLIPNKASF